MPFEKIVMAITLLIAVLSMVFSMELRHASRPVISVDVQTLIREEVDHTAVLHLNPAQRATRASWFSTTLRSALQQLVTDQPGQIVLVAPAVLEGSVDQTDWVRSYLRHHDEVGSR